MRKLITRVLVTVMLDGARTDIQPGEPLPDGVHEHDIEQLLKMRAIEEVAATAKAETNRAKADQAASKDFEDARAAVQAGRESTESVATGDNTGANAEAQAQADADAKAKADAEAQADADAKAKADAEAKAKADAEAKAKAETKAKPGTAAKGGKPGK